MRYLKLKHVTLDYYNELHEKLYMCDFFMFTSNKLNRNHEIKDPCN